MALLTVNSTTVKSPSTLSVVYAPTVKKVERVASGFEVMDVGSFKRRVECEWNYLTNAEAASLFGALDEDYFNVTYPDPVTNAGRTMSCRVQDSSIGIQRYSGSSPVGWEKAKITFTER